MLRFLISILALILSFQVVASNSDTLTSKQLENMNAIKQFKPGFEGVTASGNRYVVYGLKLKRKWTLLLVDSVSLNSFQYNKKTNELSANSEGYTDMICTAMRAKMIKQKNKPRFVADIALINYYKVSSKGLRLFQRINSTERKVKQVENQAKKAKDMAEKLGKLKK